MKKELTFKSLSKSQALLKDEYSIPESVPSIEKLQKKARFFIELIFSFKKSPIMIQQP